jgi:phosphatidylinositol-3,4,5-trisphosphate 3-phosphatase and dual-specificity protein phosphatase PTEN
MHLSIMLTTGTQVFMGWLWFIPTFHIPHPANPSPSSTSQPSSPTKFVLSRKEIDFPLGIGSDIIDVEITLRWCPEDTPATQPQYSATQDSDVSNAQGGRGEDNQESAVAGLVAGVQAVTSGDVDVEGAVEVKQAAED